MFASFHSKGTIPSCSDMLNTCASGILICSTISFSILGDIPSTPGDLSRPQTIYIYIGECVCVCVCVSFQAYTRRRLWSDRDQIWHTHANSPRKGSGQNKNLPRVTQGEFGGVLGGQKLKMWEICQMAGPISTKFGTHVRIHLGMDIG